MPMPAVEPATVEPLAVVAAETFWVAEAVMLDAVSGAEPAPMEALVRTVAIVMATAGTMVTVPDAPPAFASVVRATSWVA